MVTQKVIPIKGYRCTKCETNIFASKEKALEHYDIPEDKPFPTGFTFQHTTAIYRITSKRSLSRTLDPNCAHGWVHSYEFCPASSIHEGFYYNHSTINSKALKKDFEEGFAKILNKETIKKLKKANPQTSFIRTTRVLTDKLSENN